MDTTSALSLKIIHLLEVVPESIDIIYFFINHLSKYLTNYTIEGLDQALKHELGLNLSDTLAMVFYKFLSFYIVTSPI